MIVVLEELFRPDPPSSAAAAAAAVDLTHDTFESPPTIARCFFFFLLLLFGGVRLEPKRLATKGWFSFSSFSDDAEAAAIFVSDAVFGKVVGGAEEVE